MVLTNAIYFKSAWQNPFPEKGTQPGDFALGAAGTIQNVPLMLQVEHYPYLEADTFQAIDLPYKANELSLIIFLPRAVDGLEQFERTLTAARVDDWLARMARWKVKVILPRFKITSELRLEQPLQALGMRRAFSAGADFSGMIKTRVGFVDAAIHKAHVDVNERGTEAAAGTAVSMLTSMPRNFRADHPFVFFIRDKGTGSLLFAGRLANPLAR